MYKPNLTIIGLMNNVNKKIAKQLSTALQMHLLNTNDLIEYETGIKLNLFLNDYGEEYFYKYEKKLLGTLDKYENVLICTPCTALFDFENIKALAKTSYIIILTAQMQLIEERIEKSRFCMKNSVLKNWETYIQNISENANMYDIIIDTSTATPKDVVENILKELNRIVK